MFCLRAALLLVALTTAVPAPSAEDDAAGIRSVLCDILVAGGSLASLAGT